MLPLLAFHQVANVTWHVQTRVLIAAQVTAAALLGVAPVHTDSGRCMGNPVHVLLHPSPLGCLLVLAAAGTPDPCGSGELA